jgi:hypothetical protein
MVVVDNLLYRKEYPPILPEGQETEVKIDLKVISVGSFQELDMTFKIKFLLHMEWQV